MRQGGPLNVADPRSPSAFTELWLAAAEAQGLAAQRRLQRRGAGGDRPLSADAEERRALERGGALILTPNLGRPESRRAHGRAARRASCSMTGAPPASNTGRAGRRMIVRARREVILVRRRVAVAAAAVAVGHRRRRRRCATMRHRVRCSHRARRGPQPARSRRFRHRLSTRARKDLIGFMPGDLVNAFRSSMRYRRERRGIFASNIAEAGGFVKIVAGTVGAGPAASFLHRDPREPWPQAARERAVSRATSARCGRKSAGTRDAGNARIRSRRRGSIPASIRIPTTSRRWCAASGSRAASCESPLLARYRGKDLFTAGVTYRRRDPRPCCASAPTRSTIRSGPAGWVATSSPSSIRELRVRGIAGLRVVDASVMPTLDRRQHQRADDHDRRAGGDLIRAAQRIVMTPPGRPKSTPARSGRSQARRAHPRAWAAAVRDARRASSSGGRMERSLSEEGA